MEVNSYILKEILPNLNKFDIKLQLDWENYAFDDIDWEKCL